MGHTDLDAAEPRRLEARVHGPQRRGQRQLAPASVLGGAWRARRDPATASAAVPTVCSTHVIRIFVDGSAAEPATATTPRASQPCSTPSSRSESRRRTCSRSISACTYAHATASRWSLRNASGFARTVASILHGLHVPRDVADLAGLALVADDRSSRSASLHRACSIMFRGRDAGAVEHDLPELRVMPLIMRQRVPLDTALAHRARRRL